MSGKMFSLRTWFATQAKGIVSGRATDNCFWKLLSDRIPSILVQKLPDEINGQNCKMSIGGVRNAYTT